MTDLQTETHTHFCITGTGCRSRTVDADGVTQPAITENPGTLCDGCLSSHSNQIRRLATDYEMLRATLGERRGDRGATSRL
ncbi:MAG: hypothetical protein K2Y33_03315 [Mycolicibacterium frederiksbergense]|nr:hypothetical protein [Mycolicibacterium frederiksbergense]